MLCLLTCAACSRVGPANLGDAGAVDAGTDGSVPPRANRPAAWLWPPDLTTMYTGDFYLQVSDWWFGSTTDLVQDVTPRLAILPVAGGVEVPIQVQFDANALRFNVVPDSQLGDGWYVLEVKGEPSTVDLGAPDAHVRFSTGSHPTLQYVQFCPSDDGSYVHAQVSVSQAIDLGNDASLLTVSQDGQVAQRRPEPTIGLPDGGWETTPPPYWDGGPSFYCDGCKVDGLWRITLKPGLVAQDGKSLTTYNGATGFDVTVDGSKRPHANGCWWWHGEEAPASGP